MPYVVYFCLSIQSQLQYIKSQDRDHHPFWINHILIRWGQDESETEIPEVMWKLLENWVMFRMKKEFESGFVAALLCYRKNLRNRTIRLRSRPETFFYFRVVSNKAHIIHMETDVSRSVFYIFVPKWSGLAV